MAWTPPGSHELRQRVRFERRLRGDNVAGNVTREWASLGVRSARLMPLRGGEQVMADRSAGVNQFDLVVRFDGLTRTLTSNDRAVEVLSDGTDGPVMDIKWVQDLERKRRWQVILAEQGKGDGRG